jgi:hypothetical protein
MHPRGQGLGFRVSFFSRLWRIGGGGEVIDHIADGIYSKPLRFVKSTPTSSQCALHRFLRNDFNELIMKQVHHQPKQPPLEGKLKL